MSRQAYLQQQSSLQELKVFFLLPKAVTQSELQLTRLSSARKQAKKRQLLFGLTGTGYFDMVAYQKYNDGEMSDYIPTDADLQQGFDGLPKVD